MRVPLGDDGQEAIFEEKVLRSDGVSFCLVRWLPDGSWLGTCPGFRYRGDCKHVDRVRAQVGTRDVKADGDLL